MFDERNYRQKRVNNGRCSRCNSSPLYTKVLCKRCNFCEKARHTRRKEAYKELGICLQCGKEPLIKGLRYGIICQGKYKILAFNRHLEVRKRLLDVYGTQCACCGESEPGFLTIDHINNDGKRHRQEFGGQLYKLYLDLVENKREGIRIMCYNCNCARSRLGTCPHKTPLERVM